jgi:hypothetical protein
MAKGKAYPREGERRQCSEISTERYSVIEEELRRMHGSERFDISERARQDIQHHIREYFMAFNAYLSALVRLNKRHPRMFGIGGYHG